MPRPWEPEEVVGSLWNRMVGGAASYPWHPQAVVRLADVGGRLGTIFRALGGAGGVRIMAAGSQPGSHRLALRQRIGLDAERAEIATYDGTVVQLPSEMALFSNPATNLRLYDWLAAYFALAPPPPQLPSDRLQADVVRLRTAMAAVDRALATWPGLRGSYAALCEEVRAIRPQRRLPALEAAVEDVVATLLGGRSADESGLLAAVLDPWPPLDGLRAPPGYRSFLHNPLWGDIVARLPAAMPIAGGEDEGGVAAAGDARRRRAVRKSTDQTTRPDPLLLNRFEAILGLAEMVNLNRKVEDDDVDHARRAAQGLDEIAVGAHERRVATRLQMELDLAAEGPAVEPVSGEFRYPEWDFRRRRLVPDHCRVIVQPASRQGEAWQPDEDTERLIRSVRRQFEGLLPRRHILSGQPDGDELDLSALVRSVADRRAGGVGSERVYKSVRAIERDLSVCILVDVSLSTDGWMDDRRVLDVEKEAVVALAQGLAACGDEHAILAFTSRRRSAVNIWTLKDFAAPLNAEVMARIGALKPGAYTRIGAALRHAGARLAERPHRHRLLLLLTDGKPNDIDHYEGRYALEDTRVAVQEARRAGIKVFGITVDQQGRDYFPYLFGPGAFALFPRISRLPAALPAIYRHLTI